MKLRIPCKERVQKFDKLFHTMRKIDPHTHNYALLQPTLPTRMRAHFSKFDFDFMNDVILLVRVQHHLETFANYWQC